MNSPNKTASSSGISRTAVRSVVAMCAKMTKLSNRTVAKVVMHCCFIVADGKVVRVNWDFVGDLGPLEMCGGVSKA